MVVPKNRKAYVLFKKTAVAIAQIDILNPDAARVLSDAVARIAAFWHLSNVRLGAVIGLSGPTVSRLRAGQYRLERGSKPFELAQHLLRLFRSLDSWLGQDGDSARSWLTTPNLDLGERPIDMLSTVRGLLSTSDYVDALRARV